MGLRTVGWAGQHCAMGRFYFYFLWLVRSFNWYGSMFTVVDRLNKCLTQTQDENGIHNKSSADRTYFRERDAFLILCFNENETTNKTKSLYVAKKLLERVNLG